MIKETEDAQNPNPNPNPNLGSQPDSADNAAGDFSEFIDDGMGAAGMVADEDELYPMDAGMVNRGAPSPESPPEDLISAAQQAFAREQLARKREEEQVSHAAEHAAEHHAAELNAQQPTDQPTPGIVSDDNIAQQSENVIPDQAVDTLRKQNDVLQNQLEQAKGEAKANWEKVLRLNAQIENDKRRAKLDVEKAHKYSLGKALNALFPVVDSLEHALKVPGDTEHMEAMRSGVEMTLKMFIETLGKFGLEQVNPLGKKFDHNFQEAVSMLPDPKVAANQVIQVIQTGYVLNGKLVRPARVVVSSGKNKK